MNRRNPAPTSANRHSLSATFERDLLAPKSKAERLKHMTELVLGYLFN